MRRPEQLAEVIRHKTNEFFVKEVEFPFDSLVTITQVKITPDLKHATLFLSVLPIDREQKVLKLAQTNLGRVKHFISRHITLRKCPDLHLAIDNSNLKDRKIERALEEIDK